MARKSIPGLKTTGISVVDEYEFGLFLWELPNGRPLMDDDYNFLNVEADHKHDLQAMARICAEAKALGYEDGKPRFVSGAVQCTDEELEEWVDSGYGMGY